MNENIEDKYKDVKMEDLPLEQQREKAKLDFLKASEGNIDDNDNEELFKRKKKTKKQLKQEEMDFNKFIDTQPPEVKDFWNTENKPDDDKFLIDYIVNKRWILPEDEEPVNYNDLLEKEDDEIVEDQENFEAKYNFRHEEPEGAQIVLHSRNQPESVRRSKKQEARKVKRENQKDNKKQKEKEMEKEKQRMKNLQKKKILDRLKSVSEITGVKEEALSNVDLTGDFDPEEHDRKMKELFNDEYYSVQETKKPVFEKDEDIDNFENPHFKSSMEDLVSKANEKLGDKFSAEFDKYLDEYYNIDYEDIVGGVPIKFKYTKVNPNNYGLSTDEILKSEDKILNRIVSLKRLYPYREDDSAPQKRRKPNNQNNNHKNNFQKNNQQQQLNNRKNNNRFQNNNNNQNQNRKNNETQND